MITPGYLKEGDKIAIVAPAGKIAGKKVEIAVSELESWGLKVEIGPHITEAHYQFSSTDENRLKDFQKALDDKDVKAILCARGGYGSIRIIDKLDFTIFKHHPKWIIGFSDITIFHSHINNNYGIETIHGIMSAGLNSTVEPEDTKETLKNALFGKSLQYSMKQTQLSQAGKAKGMLVGGNLAILCSLIGSESDINTNGKILFIEEVGEHQYRIDRMMWMLKRAGKLDKLAGLIVGGFTDIPDEVIEFGKSAHEIITEITAGYTYPIWFDFPAGHQDDNRTLILGREVTMEIGKIMKLQF